MKTYTVKMNIKMDGVMYEAGDEIKLEDNQLTSNIINSLVTDADTATPTKQSQEDLADEVALLNKTLTDRDKKLGSARAEVDRLEGLVKTLKTGKKK